MPVFEYRVLQRDGAVVEGRLDAGGRQEALRLLQDKGWTPLRLSETEGGGGGRGRISGTGWRLELPWRGQRVPSTALEDFTRSLSSLLAASVPLSRALTILSKETAHPVARAKWQELHDLVIDGVSLAEAMSRSPEVFPRVYVAMVESGEAGGFLDVVLGQIAEFQARDKELRAKVYAALMYPSVLLLLAMAVLVVGVSGVVFLFYKEFLAETLMSRENKKLYYLYQKDIIYIGHAKLTLSSLPFDGMFTVQAEPKLLFVATGSGIAPFKSIIFDLLEDKKDQREIWLLWGLRKVEEMFWEEEWRQINEYYQNFHYRLMISRPPGFWPLVSGHVETILKEITIDGDWGAYLCGNREMIEETKQQLLTRGVAETKIHFEKYQ